MSSFICETVGLDRHVEYEIKGGVSS